ncbi:DUF6406 domain-containing protein [Streptomyces sclerotialus]|uniref:DUF6406 domain-containing protein n=1 Tax=Streptomyces sclerotialus TaxID=1957 RepID=UPI0004C4E0BE
MMPMNEIRLRHGVPRRGDNARFGVIHVDAREEPVAVRLVVITDEERQYTLTPGEHFPVRDETWKIDRVEDPLSEDWRVVLTKVESPSG